MDVNLGCDRLFAEYTYANRFSANTRFCYFLAPEPFSRAQAARTRNSDTVDLSRRQREHLYPCITDLTCIVAADGEITLRMACGNILILKSLPWYCHLSRFFLPNGQELAQELGYTIL